MYGAVRRVSINLSLFFLQKARYIINRDTKTCQKSPPVGPFQTIDIPPTAKFVAEEWIGVKGLVGAGFATELWVGTPPGVSGSSLYLMSVSMYPLNTWLYWLT